MTVIHETRNFVVTAGKMPHVSRTDGGHVVIRPKISVENRWNLDPARAIELMRLSMIVGEAMVSGLNEQGIPVERINFQDNGNWALGAGEEPKFHLHLYGRARNSVLQKRGEALHFPERSTEFWKSLEPLTKADITSICEKIRSIANDQEYCLRNWRLEEL